MEYKRHSAEYWNNGFKPVGPDPNKIVCSKCKYRVPDMNGHTGAAKCLCKQYTDDKPDDVLCGGPCKKFAKGEPDPSYNPFAEWR